MGRRLLHSIALVLIGCVAQLHFSQSRAVAEVRTESVGVILPLSGPMAVIGTAVKNGIELAREQYPEEFSSLKFFYEDDQFDPKKSIAAYNKLTTLNRVTVVFGFGDKLGIVLGPMVDRDQIPLVNFNFDATAAIGRTHVIRAMNHTQQYMDHLVEHFKKEGKASFDIIQAESPFFNSMVTSFAQAVGKSRTVEILARYSTDQLDFRAIILKLKSRPSHPLGLFLSPDQLVEFFKQARELKFVTSYFGTDLFETAAGIARDPNLIRNCSYPDNQVSDEFRQRYQERFGNQAQLTFAGSGFDMARLVAESYRAQSSAATFSDRLATVSNRVGVLGSFDFVADPKVGKFYQFPLVVKHL